MSGEGIGGIVQICIIQIWGNFHLTTKILQLCPPTQVTNNDPFLYIGVALVNSPSLKRQTTSQRGFRQACSARHNPDTRAPHTCRVICHEILSTCLIQPQIQFLSTAKSEENKKQNITFAQWQQKHLGKNIMQSSNLISLTDVSNWH